MGVSNPLFWGVEPTPPDYLKILPVCLVRNKFTCEVVSWWQESGFSLGKFGFDCNVDDFFPNRKSMVFCSYEF